MHVHGYACVHVCMYTCVFVCVLYVSHIHTHTHGGGGAGENVYQNDVPLMQGYLPAGIVRDRPVPIPSPGVQVTNISHVRDLSSMIALAIENPDAANGTTFNAVSDRGVTFNGLVKFCAAAAGKEPKIVYYDPKAVGVDAKKAFPFRNMVICTVLTRSFPC